MDRKNYESLNAEEQARIFKEVPFKERAELLLYSSEPALLTQSLSPEELYLVVREMDPEERVEAVCFANMPQLVFLSDIECWKKDRVSGRGFIRWLETLHTADESRLLEWFLEMDYEMVVAGFQKIVQVLKPEREYAADEVLKDLPYFTLDQNYHIFCKEENLETVKRVFETLYENHNGRYVALLEGIMCELDGEMEEDALRMRQMRLAERGFADPETSREVYRPITAEEFERAPLKNPAKRADVMESIPDYPSLWRGEKLFLDDVMALFADASAEEREGVREELVWLSNKLIGCEGIDFASEDHVRSGVERVRCLVNIGLESLSGRDVRAAYEILRTRWIETVLRRGATLLFEARAEARKMLEFRWKDQPKPFFEFMGPPHETVFRGILRTLPEYHDPAVTDGVEELRDFRCLRELEETRVSVRRVKTIHTWLERHLPHLFKQGVFLYRQGGMTHTLTSLLGTVYVRAISDGKISENPVVESGMKKFFETAFVPGKTGRKLDRGIARDFIQKNSASPEEAQLLEPVWAQVLARLESELGELPGPAAIDPRFLTSVRVFKRAA